MPRGLAELSRRGGSVPITLARLSSNRVLVGAAWSFTTVFRGAPALVVVYMVYNGVATLSIVRDTFLWNIFSEAYYCAVIGLTLNHSGFLTEVIRGALQAVPRDVIEAARSMGLTRRLVFVKITAPLAVRYGLSAYLNEIILFVKGTAVVSEERVIPLSRGSFCGSGGSWLSRLHERYELQGFPVSSEADA